MKRLALFSLFHIPGIFLMAYSIGHWGKVTPLLEWAAIAACVTLLSASIYIWFWYKEGV